MISVILNDCAYSDVIVHAYLLCVYTYFSIILYYEYGINVYIYITKLSFGSSASEPIQVWGKLLPSNLFSKTIRNHLNVIYAAYNYARNERSVALWCDPYWRTYCFNWYCSFIFIFSYQQGAWDYNSSNGIIPGKSTKATLVNEQPLICKIDSSTRVIP